MRWFLSMFIIEFCEYMEILQHISVRWLSLERCITRTLMLYDPLASCFKSTSVYSYPFHYAPTNNCSMFMNCIHVICAILFTFVHRWETAKVQETSGGFLQPHDRGVVPVLPSHHSSVQLFQPPSQSSVFLLHDGVQYESEICFFSFSRAHWLRYNFLNYNVDNAVIYISKNYSRGCLYTYNGTDSHSWMAQEIMFAIKHKKNSTV